MHLLEALADEEVREGLKMIELNDNGSVLTYADKKSAWSAYYAAADTLGIRPGELTALSFFIPEE